MNPKSVMAALAAAMRIGRKPSCWLFGTALAIGGLCSPALAYPGVTPTEVVVGTHVDLSGPLSPMGAAVRNGLRMGFDDVNARGGMWGRKITMVVADNGYDPDKALAAEKNELAPDRVFAILAPVGTPPVAAAMPVFVNAGVLHLFPFTATDETYVPRQPLEFALELSLADQMRTGLKALMPRGEKRVGVLYRDDAFGKQVLDAVEHELQRRGSRPPVMESFRPGAAGMARQLAALRADGAQVVVIGGVAQEAFAAMRSARRWSPAFLCPQACYVPQVPTLGGRAVAGLYAVATTPIPYPDDTDPALRSWVRRYESRYHTVASAEAFRAYLDARLFAEVLRRAGPVLTRARFARTLEAMAPWRDPIYGGVPIDFTSRDHLGFHAGLLAQVHGGRWITIASTQSKR
ncbi:MAG: ABC transporter substrate-binding protein [Rhizomicrobium sp.]